MSDSFSRTVMLLGEQRMEKLKNAAVAVFGLGGVGSFAAEALARCGVGRFLLVDGDRVCPSNINRQLVAAHSTIGCLKAEVMRRRIIDINPNAVLEIFPDFYNDQTADRFELSDYRYIVDAIDTVTFKLLLIERAKAAGVPIISSMGAGNKLDPTRFEVADIYKTSVCPLAKVMRHELRRRGVDSLKVVYSKEPPVENYGTPQEMGQKRVPGSISFVPSVAGLILAAEVVKDIVGI